jgi:hypothetical protein
MSLTPAYQSTEKGLLVNNFLAHTLRAGAPPDQVHEIHISIEYQTVSGVPIPGRLKMSAIGRGELDYAFTGCSVIRLPK